MKKRIIMIAAVLAMSLIMFTSCGRTYDEADNSHEDFCNGYFTKIKEWDIDNRRSCYIVYANDTNVKYMIISNAHQFGITPLYNADGTLQIYEED